MTKQDYGILITQPGSDASAAPTLNKTTLNTAYAQLKIDTTNPTGFQTLTMSIVNDPPEPVGTGHRYTIIYQYKHNYIYMPAVETLFNVTTPPPGSHYTTPYFLEWTSLSAHTVSDYAALYALADNTNVYYIVDKWNGGSTGMPNLLTGTNVSITTHCFLDGVGV